MFLYLTCGGLVAKSCPILVAPWTVAYQAPLSMGFSRQDYWSGLSFPSPSNILIFKNKLLPQFYQLSYWGFAGGSVEKNQLAMQEMQVDPWVRRIPWRRKWQPIPVFLPGEFHDSIWSWLLLGCFFCFVFFLFFKQYLT